jgi:hypothetical protein
MVGQKGQGATAHSGDHRREGALIELDKHNWPWSMTLVPVMPVDLFELANNRVWETGFAFRDFGEAPDAAMGIERDARGYTELNDLAKEQPGGVSRSGWDESGYD